MAIIKGNGGDNRLKGTGSKDEIEGYGGNDVLIGRGGNDELEGGSGDDVLRGGGGNDELEGGQGNDILNGGSGINTLEGGGGADIFIFRKGQTEIDDFKSGVDLIRIDKSLGVSNFAELKARAVIADDSEDVVFDFGDHILQIDDARLSQLDASDFEFV